jgi:propanol-preferring alcohol dehydrogenase
VIGVGGLGHVAVQLLGALTPARIVAVDTRADPLELALRSGADAALDAEGLTARDLRRAAGGHGATLVIDCVGAEQTLELAAGAVSAGGHVAVLGLAGATFPMRFGTVPLETSVIFSNWGTRSELAEVIDLARDGTVRIEVERVPLSDVVAAYARLEAGLVSGRIVAVPNGAVSS